ncbi:MAG: outer membrane lipoprotein-sorting protein [Deltaproteobacteria bacterium]|nr:outer membrane lipoprotein-sorting protein [Deltaproteobacteria bacterium]
MCGKGTTVVVLAAAVLLTRPVPAEAASADDIVAKSQRAYFYAGSDMKARVLMTLASAGGQKRTRELTMLRRNKGDAGEQQYFMYFHQPADVKAMTFLVEKYPNKDDDRWLFIPGINMVKRIAARDAAQSFVGSDFTYEHVSGRDLDADEHRLLPDEKVEGKDCHVVESVPRSAAEYKRKRAWIDKSTLLPLKEEYFDGKGELFKAFKADEVRSIGGVPTVIRRTMTNRKTGHTTTVSFTDVAYDAGIEADIFTERYLRDPPGRWIK